jgi:L-lactate dehydrogenase
LHRNAGVFREAVPQVLEHAPEAVIVVATNPVDLMTHLAARIAADYGAAPGQVLGSGTTLDTARFRSLLGLHCGVDPHHVHGYVVGEHGDSEVLTWSLVTVAGMSLSAFTQLRGVDLSEPARREIDTQVRGAAYSIIGGKGATYYGIGSALARIADAVLHDQRSVLTVCAPSADVLGVPDVTLALPRLVGGSGVLETFPLPLSEEEQAQLRRSAEVIRRSVEELEAGSG